MIQGKTLTMCWLQNWVTLMTRGHRIWTPSTSIGEMEGKLTDIIVDNGTQHLVLTKLQGNLTQKKYWVQGAIGMIQYSLTIQRTMDLRMGWVSQSHSFLIIPNCPYPLLERYLLTKV